jgi:phosphatidylinositol alpha-1,6-mannosyltransferase
MPAVWNRTHVFAMPSRGEGFGLVYIEAMRHAIPVIASVHDAAQEINLDADTGFNVNLDHPGALDDRVIHLLRNPDDADRLGLNGQRRWRDHFTYTAFARRFTPHLRQFLEF